jgi:hypothetical protein
MLGLIIDALVLVILLKTFHEEDIGFGTASIVAVVAALGTAALAIGCAVAIGPVGIYLGTVIAAG